MRSKLEPGVPLEPHEPAAFFDMGDQEKIEMDLSFRKSCKYIKFVPTAFREEPINYSSKQFHAHQAEC